MVQFTALALPAFLASLVEFVEAFTIVLAVGTSRSWRAALAGAAAAVVALAALLAAFGASLVGRIDERVLLLVIGVLLLLFGGRWLRKAMLRSAGVLAQRDEDIAYQHQLTALRGRARGRRFDWAAFAVSGKGVFLEGVEVAFIVITLGVAAGGYLPPVLGAGAALLAVAGFGALARRPLSRVPENTLKYAVGAMLTTFGVYWTAEGLGVAWAGGPTALVYLLAATLAASWLGVRWLRRTTATRTTAEAR